MSANASWAVETAGNSKQFQTARVSPSIYEKTGSFSIMSALRSKLFHSSMQFTKTVAQRLGYRRRLVVQQRRGRCWEKMIQGEPNHRNMYSQCLYNI